MQVWFGTIAMSLYLFVHCVGGAHAKRSTAQSQQQSAMAT